MVKTVFSTKKKCCSQWTAWALCFEKLRNPGLFHTYWHRCSVKVLLMIILLVIIEVLIVIITVLILDVFK